MAVEADRVVVELIAQTQGFDAQIKQSGQNFTSTMGEVEKASKGVEAAAGDVYTAHNRMGIATNNARIAQMELEHVVRGSIDSYASGGNAVQIFAQHIASVAEAATFMGGSLGAVGEILSGPWGIAITAGVAILATMISRHKEEATTVDTLVEKLKKHYEQTQLQNEADERWGHTLDGLLDKLNKLNAATAGKLQLPNLVNQQSFGAAQDQVDRLNRAIDRAEANPSTDPAQLTQLYKDLAAAVTNLRLQTSVLGGQIGEVFSDLNKKADDWAQYQENKIRYITGIHPELGPLTGEVEAAFQGMKKAVDDAAKAGVPFDTFTKRVDALNERLAQSPDSINSYISGLKQISAELEKIASIKPEEAIKKFEQAVVGAEGTGPNRMGSSASGIGQFMPGTWLEYFNKLFPQFSDMTDSYKLDQRNNPSAAKAVIEAAANDYADALKRAGITITETSLYAMHVLGQRDALKLLNAPGNEPTSAFLSSKVLSGNPFLKGTASDALGAIGKRIGDSSGSVGTAVVEMQRAYDGLLTKATEVRDKEAEVTVAKDHQVAFTEQLLHGNETLAEFVKTHIIPGLKDWDKEYQQIIDSMAEANRFGAQLVDDILDPSNWDNWGDAAKKVLHEILQEILLLGAANPLKNLLFGQHNPTLGSIFGQLFGGGGGSLGSLTAGKLGQDAAAVIPHLAGGGILDVGGSGGTDHNLLSINGQSRAMVSANEKLAIIPSNAVAAAAGGGGSGGVVRVVIEASPYFDGRVMQVSGPVIVQAGVAAAHGGATLSRQNLGRESMHRLE